MDFIHRFLQRVMHRLAGAVYARPWPILIVAIILTIGAAIGAAMKFQVISNTENLLDETSPTNRTYMAFKKEFGADETYLVLVQSDDKELNKKVSEEVAAWMAANMKPWVKHVTARIDFSRLRNKLLFLVPAEELKKIEAEVGANAAELQSNAVQLSLEGVLDEAVAGFDKGEELRDKAVFEAFLPKIQRFTGVLQQLATVMAATAPKAAAAAVAPSIAAKQGELDFANTDADAMLNDNEFITFQGGKVVLVVGLRGEQEDGERSPYYTAVTKLRAHLDTLRAKYPQIRFSLTGEPVLADDEMRTTNTDTVYASLITLVLISCLFFFSYRHLERPLWAGVALGMAMAWTLGFTMLGIGHFNIISQAVIPMALGLGVDFGIQILSRYEEELAQGHDVRHALNCALTNTGVAVITGGSTTAVAFFTICFNEFLGLRELGAIAGMSIVFALIANLVILPSIFVIRDRRKDAARLKREGDNSNWSHLAPLDNIVTARPRATLIGAGLVTIASLILLFAIRFDYNLLNLQNKALESVQSLHELFRLSEGSTIYASIMTNSREEAKAMEEKVAALPSVKKVESLGQLYPLDQQDKLPLIEKIVAAVAPVKVDVAATKAPVDVAKVKADIEKLLAQSQAGLKESTDLAGLNKRARQAVEIFNGLIPPLEQITASFKSLSPEETQQRLNTAQDDIFGKMVRNLGWLKTQTPTPIELTDLPVEVRERFCSPTGKVLLQVYAKEDIWERAPNLRFVDELRSIAPDVTGTPVQNYEYIELLRTSFVHAALWAFVAIVVLLTLHFADLRLVTLAVFPLVLAVIWRTGLMGALDIPFNPANVVTLPLIIGIDVAYGVYVVDRFREDRTFHMFSTSTGKAIIMTALTALFGFVSLLVSQYHGMYSIGLLMSLGIGIGLITTVVVLPQILKLIEKSREGKAESSGKS